MSLSALPEGVELIRHPRARRAKLSVDPASGRTRLVVPPRMALRTALAFADAHRDWIAAQRDRLPVPRPFVDGAVLPVAGEPVTIALTGTGPRGAWRDGDRLVVTGPLEGAARRIDTWLRREALRLLTQDTAHYAALAGVGVEGVAIGDPRGRWGSCSGRGAIRYSWRLLLAPPEVRRATAAHEVAHRVHMHHAPTFHALVAKLYGTEPSAERAWLKANGAALHWYGRPLET